MWTIYTFKKGEEKQENDFPTRLFQFRVVGGQGLSRQLRAQRAHPPWTECPSIARHITHMHAHPD